MHARSALFDVYGDHLRGRGSQAPVAGLVRLLDPVGIAAPAVRTAISRMVHAGLAGAGPARAAAAATARPTRAIRRLDEAADRIYRRTDPAWDGTLAPRVRRPARRPAPRAPGCGPTSASWGTPSWPTTSGSARSRAPSSTSVLERAGADRPDRAGRLASTRRRPAAWDLDALRAAYDDWLATADDLVAAHAAGHDDADEAAFAARFHLVHEWRKFLFADPGLPDELLPARLAGPGRGRPVRRRGDPAQARAPTGSWRAASTAPA